MNTTLILKTEDLSGLDAAELQQLAANVAAISSDHTLDAAWDLLVGNFSPLGWFLHRGGHHIALHRVSGGVRVLIVEEREVEQPREQLASFTSLKSAVTVARTEAQREARREGRKLTRVTITGRVVPAPCRFIRSRGTSLVALDAQGRCKAFDEPWQWDGTKAQLLDALRVALAQTPEAQSLELFGGFDLSETFDFSDYEPEFTSWDITVWTRAGGWQF